MKIVSLTNKFNNDFFNDGCLPYFLYQIRLISELQKVESCFSATGCEYIFKVFLTYGMSFEMGFDKEVEASSLRQNIIMAMMQYWGPDNIICSNGIAYDVTIVQAVKNVSDVFEQDDKAFFRIEIEFVTHPINFIFFDVADANKFHDEIICKLQLYRKISKNISLKMAVNQN